MEGNGDNQICEKRIEKKVASYRFMFFAALSLLFVITFVYFLPSRFEQSAGERREKGMMEDMMDEDGHMQDNDGHAQERDFPDASSLVRLPMRTPESRVAQLPFTTLADGTKEFLLEASEFRWEYEPGSWVHVWGYNGQIPGPEIRVTEGDKVRVVIKNSLPDATTIHWHGVDVPWQMDGVANVTQAAIQPQEEFVYEFVAKPAGTRFYHTHGKDHTTSSQQLDMGLSGAFIVEPKDGEEPDYAYDNEYTLVLDEWDIASGVNSAAEHVHGAAEAGAVPDFNTFTINGRIFPNVDPIIVREGESTLIRVINAGTSASHPMHLHGHSFEVVATDGFALNPVARERRNTVTVHPGETLDILVDANNPGPWLLHCHHVHHASAGMIMLFQYEGYEPVGS